MLDEQTVTAFADRLFRRHLLSMTLGEDSGHPCLENEDLLLRRSESAIRAWADSARRSPSWPSMKTWFSNRVHNIILRVIPYYGYQPSVNEAVLREIDSTGFDHLLERESSRSGVRASPGSNVISLRKCKT